jgi:hypothetical protein
MQSQLNPVGEYICKPVGRVWRIASEEAAWETSFFLVNIQSRKDKKKGYDDGLGKVPESRGRGDHLLAIQRVIPKVRSGIQDKRVQDGADISLPLGRHVGDYSAHRWVHLGIVVPFVPLHEAQVDRLICGAELEPDFLDVQVVYDEC